MLYYHLELGPGTQFKTCILSHVPQDSDFHSLLHLP